MRYLNLICLLAILSMSARAAMDDRAIIYLKWYDAVTPRLVDGKWQTGEPSLDAIFVGFQLGRVERAFHLPFGSDPVGLRRVLRLELSSREGVSNLLSALRELPGTEYAEERAVRHTSVFTGKTPGRGVDNVPGDPLYPDQWMFPVMQAPAAWDVTHGNPSVVVAIVDNGTDWGHPDIDYNIWSNPGEIAGNGVDDDGNGFTDDARGWDFQDDDNNPEPELAPGESYVDYHGTHTAGLVGALMNNGRGVVGIAPSCKVMPVRTGTGGNIYYGIEGILYASHNGADVISLSWGGPGSYSLEQDIITDAMLQGSMIVAAAGNEGSSDPHYPAAYDGVMAVASTDPDDGISSFSNYGTWISVSAPGQVMLSLFPDGYGLAYGTSMSTPLVAGIAALVKSVHSSWTPEQIYAQILYTADDVTAQNPLYMGLMGSGRVNAYRAVAESAPGLQVADLAFSELSGNFDGKLDPGEMASVVLSLHNGGASTEEVSVSLSCDDPAVQVNQSSWSLAEMASGETASNSSGPFEIYVQSWSQGNREVQLTFSVESESFYSASLNAPIWISPSFANHDTGNVIFTITDFGCFGYYDYVHDEYYGSGFRFPREGSNALYHGALMAGSSPSQVSDCAYGSDSWPYRFDWQAILGGDLSIFPGTQADQEGLAIYQDTRPPTNQQVGLQVTQRSYAWSSPPRDDFVILSFSLENVSGSAINNLYVGLYMDWDLINFNENEANWDAELALGYVYNAQPLAPNTRYYGTCLLTSEPASYRVIDSTTVYPFSLMTDAQKYEFMSSGFVQTSSSGPSDQSTLLSAGPFSLAAEQTVEVAFAVLGGDDLGDLQDNATEARSAWNELQPLSSDVGQASVGHFSIDDVFPRPANGELRIRISMPGPGEVLLDLFDPLGRSFPLSRNTYTEAGAYLISLPRWNGASGVYFVRGNSPYGASSRKIVWMK